MLSKLSALFERKGWGMDRDLEISTFNRYVSTLSRFDEAHQDFMMEISDRFLFIPQSDYLNRLLKPLSDIRNKYPQNQLVFACCISEDDDGKIKSSSSVLSQIKGTEIKTRINLGNIFVVSKQSDLSKCNIKNDQKIVLVDDFVGTGETADAAIDYVVKLLPGINPKKKVIFLCIAAMEAGVNHLKGEGYEVYYETICRRGISDFYQGKELRDAQSIMDSIEKSIPRLQSKFRFGYKRSEGLISMGRCPNNTFPIYWLGKNTAPYER